MIYFLAAVIGIIGIIAGLVVHRKSRNEKLRQQLLKKTPYVDCKNDFTPEQ